MYWGKNLVGNCEAKRDWVINAVGMRDEPYSGIKGLDKFGVVVTNTDNGTVHGSTNSASVFSQVDNLKKVVSTNNWNGGLPYYSQSGSTIQFYQVNSNIIWPNHPQFNKQTPGFIDTTKPCNY